MPQTADSQRLLRGVAELPELLRRPGVLEENLINVERIKLAGPVTIDDLPNAGDELSQFRRYASCAGPGGVIT